MSDDIRDEMTGYKADAIDGDGDGMVQDATPFERPLGTELTEDQVEAILEGTETVDEVISAPEPVVTEEPALAPVADGVIGTGTKSKKKPKVSDAKKGSENTVALHSSRNVYWVGVGRINKGYNILPKAEADKWLTRSHVRLVDPSEMQELA